MSHDGLGRAARRAGLGEEGVNSWVRGALAGVLDQESGQERLEATGLRAGAGGSCSTAARFPTASSCGNGKSTFDCGVEGRAERPEVAGGKRGLAANELRGHEGR